MNAKGSVFKYPDNVDTDVIIPARHLNTQDAKELASHCMEDIDKEFVKNVQDGDVMLRYAEPDNDGEAVWVLTADLVDLQRQGHITSRFTFIEGRLTDAPYTTPHGPIALQLYTHSAELDVDRERLLFKARYTVLAQGKAVADNHLRVEARFV